MIKFKPEYLNDTPRKYPRTLSEAFPAAPTWGQDVPPLSDRVLMYVCAFATGFLTALLVFS
jgi:hypothetical protein